MKILLISLLLFTSCTQNKQDYTYIETCMQMNGLSVAQVERKPLTISATTDYEAYANACMNFYLAQKGYNEEFKKSGTLLGKPISFKMLNKNSEDIRQRISLEEKKHLEKLIRSKVENLKLNK